VRQRQQRHHGPAGRSRWPGLDELVPGAAIGGSGEDLVAIDQMGLFCSKVRKTTPAGLAVQD
jgi:hypothetical protein